MQVWQLAWRRSLTAWFYVPIGVLFILLACWGIDSLIGLSSVSFPASVALLILLFFALILCDFILGDRRTKKLVHVFDVPVSFHTFKIMNINSSSIRLGSPFAISMCSSPHHSVSASDYGLKAS